MDKRDFKTYEEMVAEREKLEKEDTPRSKI